MRKAILFGSLAVLALGFAPVPFPKPDTGKDDLKKMQGTWNRLTCTQGQIPPVARPVNDLVVIKDNTILYGGGAAWTLTLGTAEGKKTFDIKQGTNTRGWVGIYELKGDTLRVCFTPAATRPRASSQLNQANTCRSSSARSPEESTGAILAT